MTQFRLAIMTGAAIALTWVMPTITWAQENQALEDEARAARDLMQLVRLLERNLEGAEDARQEGRCGNVRTAHRFFQETLGNGTTPRMMEVIADFRRRMDEIAFADCPPGSGTPSVPPPVVPTTPTPATPEPVVAPEPPAAPGTIGSAGTLAPDEPESILDEAADDINSTAPDRSTSPASGAVPGPAGSVGSQTPATTPPQAPAGEPRQDILDGLVPLRPALYAAIAGCDREAFQTAKNRLLEAIGQLLTRYPGNIHLLAERRRIEETQFPQPCPPGVSENLEGYRYPWEDEPVGLALGVEYRREHLPLSIDIMLGEFSDIPQTGIGVRRDGSSGEAPELTAGETDDRVSTIGLEGSISIPLGGMRPRTMGDGSNLTGAAAVPVLRIRAGYSEGDGDTVFDVPAAPGTVAGIVYGQLSPGGSSGIIAPFPLAGQTRLGLSQFRLGAELGLARPTHRVFVSLDYFRLDRNHELSASGAGTSGGFDFQFTQQRDQDLGENYFVLGAGGEVWVPLGRRLVVLFRASGAGYLRESALDSVELNTSNFGPAADRSFTVDIEDSESDFGFRGEAGMTLELQVSRNVALFVGGGADYWSSVGAIFNPNSGDQVFFDGLTTELRTGDSWSWRAGAGLIIRFGGR